MPIASSAQVHPTAIVSAEADIGPNVRIGPFAIVDGQVSIAGDCVIGPHVLLIGPLILGQGNQIGAGTVIGSDPQHLGYRGEPTRTEIGDLNVFREHVTVHRGSHDGRIRRDSSATAITSWRIRTSATIAKSATIASS